MNVIDDTMNEAKTLTDITNQRNTNQETLETLTGITKSTKIKFLKEMGLFKKYNKYIHIFLWELKTLTDITGMCMYFRVSPSLSPKLNFR